MNQINLEEIKQMLAHYYDGTSTQEEEKYLRIYFKNTDRVAPELRTEGEIFRSLSDIMHPTE